jgi:glutathione S-transferase
MAISAWLEARDAERQISFDPISRDTDLCIMHQFMAFINKGFTGAFSPLWAAMELEPPKPALQSALREWGREAVAERHDRLEEMIGDTRFLISDRPTQADAILIGIARWLDYHELADQRRYPKLAALRARLESDPAVLYATALENGDMQAGNGACKGHVELRDATERFGLS